MTQNQEQPSTQPLQAKTKLLQLLVITVGAALLINAFLMAVIANLNLGLFVLGIFAIALIGYGTLWYRSKAPKWMHFFVTIVCAVLLSFSGFLFLYGMNDNTEYNEDAVIVLGAGIRGEQVSNSLAYRLDKAVEYYERNPRAVIVVSGGQGHQESITEALAMERYLVEKGIPKTSIIKEEKATSTSENFLFSDALLKEKFTGQYSAVFITNDFHVFRANAIAQSAGIETRHMGAPIDWYTVPATYTREMMAVLSQVPLLT